MNSKDLEYIFSTVKFQSKTEYPKTINIGTRGIQLKYLRNSQFNYEARVDENNKKFIDILRKDKSKILTISQNVYPTNSKSGIRLGMDKVKTEQHLENRGIRTPFSKTYHQTEIDKAYKETFELVRDNVVVKPSNASLGKGVVVDVGKEEFYNAWSYASQAKGKGREIVVQEYIPGFEARATVIQGRLHSIVLRIPPYIVGDGRSTLSQLIDLKNKERKKHSHLSKAPIEKSERIKSYLRSNKLDLDDIPEYGEYVLLVSVSNFSLGGELMDITDLVSEKIKETILKALAAMPGLYTAGLDIMMKSFEDEEPVVLEINSYPAINLATYPTYGKLENPFKSYIESVVAMDQFINPPKDPYDIKNSEEYIRDMLKFMKLRNEIDYQRNDI